MFILGIESSCDETAIAIIDDKRKIHANVIASQIKKHQPYGGVVPEIASRSHLDKIDIVIKKALKTAKLELSQIDLIAVTNAPGLIGGLVVGTSIAKTIAAAMDIPVIAVNHLEAHALMASFTEESLTMPYLLLLASGGHCQLVSCKDVANYKLLGQTIDDAIGEAFDKVAKLLGLPYPGGPNIENAAKSGDPTKYPMPIAMRNSAGCDFSLSGLKTQMRYLIEDLKKQNDAQLSKENIADISASFQQNIADMITNRLAKAIKIYQTDNQNLTAKNFVFSGGVAANQFIREQITNFLNQHDFKFYVPPVNLCTDNGVMIAWCGYLNYLRDQGKANLTFTAKSRSNWC
jgi:N6-L-threonylcarbamoyladenine synthase